MNAATPGSLYSKFLDPAEQAFLAVADDQDVKKAMQEELHLAQLMVKRALEKASEDPALLMKALLTLARLREAYRRLSGDAAAGIIESLTTILNEFGLGETDTAL